MSKLVEGLWDCPYCGYKEIGGLTKKCPKCGHPQDQDTVFYLKGEKKYIDEETAKDYGKGADWICPYCGSLNKYDSEICSGCSAPREHSEGDYFSNKDQVKNDEDVAELGYKAGEAYGNVEDEATKKKPEKVKADVKRKETDYERKRREDAEKKRLEELQRKKKQRLMMFAGVAAVFVAILAFLFWPRKVTSQIESKIWFRNITIEEYKTVDESDWKLPEGGRLKETKNEIHHYDTVLDHYETVTVTKTRQVLDGYDTYTEYVDNGDGTFSEETREEPRYVTETYEDTEEKPIYVEVPIFQKKYYYEIERWIETRSIDTSGENDEPYWGELDLNSNEREGNRSEEYTLCFTTNKGDAYTLKVAFEYWNSFEPGEAVELTISGSTIKKINGKTPIYF